MAMWWMKACPKCNGDLFEDTLFGDWDIKCLQCGYILPRQEGLALKARLGTERRVPASRGQRDRPAA